MHREYRPEEMDPLAADPLALAGSGTGDDGVRRLLGFTVLLGLLIGGDVLQAWLGWPEWRPLGMSLSLIAALLGAVYIVYGALEALAHRRLGADFALAQACIAAPSVAASRHRLYAPRVPTRRDGSAGRGPAGLGRIGYG